METDGDGASNVGMLDDLKVLNRQDLIQVCQAGLLNQQARSLVLEALRIWDHGRGDKSFGTITVTLDRAENASIDEIIQTARVVRC